MKPHKRFQLAVKVITITRFLASLTKKITQNTPLLLPGIIRRTPSYVTIDINPPNDVVSSLNIDPTTLNHLVKDRSFECLQELGGVKAIAAVLETDEKDGIKGNEADLTHRKNVFGSNNYHKPKGKSFLGFVLEAFKDTTIIILLICAVFSLGFGIKEEGIKEGWYDGGSIVLAIFLVISVSAVSNFKQRKQFEKLSSESNDVLVEVVRDGRRQSLSIFEVVVGDLVFLNIGDQIPADGLFLDGHSLKVDESSMTGESDHVEVNGSQNPFLISGTKVTDGYGHMIVTAVGMNTAWGQLMSAVNADLDERTPLQARLDTLTSYIGKAGLMIAFLVLVVLITRYFTGNTRDEKGKREFNGGDTKMDSVMNSVVHFVSAAVTIIVVAIPEGLPLAVTLTLAYSMKRMMSDNAMVKKLSACETMGSATTICTDKTGTLTLNQMKVTEFWLGKEIVISGRDSVAIPVLEDLRRNIGLNTTGSIYRDQSASTAEISGSPTEKALLSWGVFDLDINIDELYQQFEIIHVEAFNSEKKRSGVLIRRKSDNSVEVQWKGAAEMILAMCSSYVDRYGIRKAMEDEERLEHQEIIKKMGAKSLRCIAFGTRTILRSEDENEDNILEETGLTLMGIVGLKDPCRPGAREAVDSCRAAGVDVKMITGDNVFTAKAIAVECGIVRPDEADMDNTDSVIEGIQFRNYSDEDRMARIDGIRVMARSSPFDKLLMVQCLKRKGHVVAVTGDGTNDAPALKEADIGLSMGIQGTEVAKESSDIIIMDDNFASVVTVLQWGRCVYNNIQKFIQFQLTVNIAALAINFVAAVSSGNVPLTAVQLLWVNLIMDTLGALALATERPTDDLMKKSPVGRSEALITPVMWRNLIVQACYQVTVLLTLQFKGRSIFGVTERVNNTMIFNAFVLCQVFNEFNARNLEKKNIFKGVLKNKLFLGIIGITVVLQVVMVEFLKKFATTERLNWGQWAVCVGIAAMSWPIGWLVKCIHVK